MHHASFALILVISIYSPMASAGVTVIDDVNSPQSQQPDYGDIDRRDGSRVGLVSSEDPDRKKCARTQDVVSINVAFSYKNSRNFLGTAPLADQAIHARMADGFAEKRNIHSLSDVNQNWTKQEFLKKLKTLTNNSDVVHFNYAGHGARLVVGDLDSEFIMLLPAPDAVHAKCAALSGAFREDNTKIESWALERPECADYKNYIVSSKDLGEVFGARKVFGIIDACYAGGITRGVPSGAFLTGANYNKTAKQYSNGAFTKYVANTMEKSCELDRNNDQQVSTHELYGGIIKNLSQERELLVSQEPRIRQQGWLDCYIPKLPNNCKKTFFQNDIAELITETSFTSSERQNVCTLNKGTKVKVLKDRMAADGMIAVEATTNCGFTRGLVPISNLLKLQPTEVAPQKTPPGNVR